MSIKQSVDVAILGGGLAGLTLALQLKKQMPELSITVLERRQHPVPLAAHKVGESTVEIGAHYFDQVLGLKEWLDAEQLRKFGFRFFFNDKRADIDNVTELGTSTALPTPSYQLDRGIFENRLGLLASEQGVQFIDGAMVKTLSLANAGKAQHQVSYESKGELQTLEADWVIDASGRAGLIKRKLDLAETNAHDAGAVWFRISERIDINDWSSNEAWLGRSSPRERWLSTNHLVGEGYWVWLIPLASGSHSVGIVADPRFHPIESINSFDKAMAWFAIHQPQLYKALDVRRDKLQDFAFFKRFSYGCKQVFSGANRWALTGEAGLFLDPFYSPGSDFIAIANTYITELIHQDHQRGPVALLAGIYQDIYFSLYQNMLSLYQNQYQLFGDAEVMPVKVLWDYAYYWGIMCPLFFQNQLTNTNMMARMGEKLSAIQSLNGLMQAFMRSWHKVSQQKNQTTMLDQAKLGWFALLNKELRDKLSDSEFLERIDLNLERLDTLASEIVLMAARHYPNLDSQAVVEKINPQIFAKVQKQPSQMIFSSLN